MKMRDFKYGKQEYSAERENLTAKMMGVAKIKTAAMAAVQ